MHVHTTHTHTYKAHTQHTCMHTHIPKYTKHTCTHTHTYHTMHP